eukprot:CAMPEP_0175195584 /NCGR_PEP_ID=MMETSP0093-20121207/7071_1 /TAXON_ID=311494 /ORGANISM="Alexandrium monilatum, Strain CCMP3105" /LENGTH=247 /DNA_ID=CAMNT_0016488519 /DNA_START=198 /DNA_END=942 /DNA_ORIENTATION=-
MSGKALAHRGLHGLKAELALACGVALTPSWMLHEELQNHLIGVDFLGCGTELRRLEGRGARPGVATPLNHDKHNAGIIFAVKVLVQDNVLLHANPLVVLALVEARPVADRVRHGGVPVGRVPGAPVRVDQVVRPVDGDDGHGEGGVVGRWETQAPDRRNPLDEGRKLGGQAPTEAGPARVADAADAVHVDAQHARHVPQDISGVPDVIGHARDGAGVQADVEALDPSLSNAANAMFDVSAHCNIPDT